MESGDEGVLAAFGRRMRARRLEAGRTQRQIAVAAGIDVRYYSKIENGKINVTLTTLTRLAKAMKCPRLLALPSNGMQELETEICSAVCEMSRKGDTARLQQLESFIHHVLEFRHVDGVRARVSRAACHAGPGNGR
jgi:transcriptional regulator with XRE-family HTH domain